MNIHYTHHPHPIDVVYHDYNNNIHNSYIAQHNVFLNIRCCKKMNKTEYLEHKNGIEREKNTKVMRLQDPNIHIYRFKDVE